MKPHHTLFEVCYRRRQRGVMAVVGKIRVEVARVAALFLFLLSWLMFYYSICRLSKYLIMSRCWRWAQNVRSFVRVTIKDEEVGKTKHLFDVERFPYIRTRTWAKADARNDWGSKWGEKHAWKKRHVALCVCSALPPPVSGWAMPVLVLQHVITKGIVYFSNLC